MCQRHKATLANVELTNIYIKSKVAGPVGPKCARTHHFYENIGKRSLRFPTPSATLHKVLEAEGARFARRAVSPRLAVSAGVLSCIELQWFSFHFHWCFINFALIFNDLSLILHRFSLILHRSSMILYWFSMNCHWLSLILYWFSMTWAWFCIDFDHQLRSDTKRFPE